MIIEIEDRFCKAAQVFSETLKKVERAAQRGDAVHKVEEATFRDLMETGRQMVVAYIQGQDEDLPRPEVIQYEGKTLHRLPERRTRPYVSAFGSVPFARDVYATRETQTPGGGALGRKTRHAGERHVLSVFSFPRSAWERTVGRSAARASRAAERRGLRSHAGRGNEKKCSSCSRSTISWTKNAD